MRCAGILSNFDNPWEPTPSKPKNQGKSSDNKVLDFDSFLKNGSQKMRRMLFQGHNSGNGESAPGGFLLLAGALIMLLLWLSTGFYTIDTNEEGVVLRFGKYHRTSAPGLNYKLPAPFEIVEKLSVTRINKEVIGLKQFATKTAGDDAGDDDVSIQKESQMLTGDENIIEMHFFVQWLIKDAKSYLFNIKDDRGESTIKVSAESAMRQVVGRAKISEALSEQRQEIEQKVKDMLQSLLDNYGSGIEVVNVGILYSYVAPEVRDAYRDIQSAKADKEREINEALAYRNDIIPRARGEAKAMLEEANAYTESIVLESTGQAQRFRDILTQYRLAKDITKERLYIEGMEQVLKGMNKTVIDSSVGAKALPLLSINDLNKKQQ